jgi:hypothetical protein
LVFHIFFKFYRKESRLSALIEWQKNKKGCVFFTEVSINLADDPELLGMIEANVNLKRSELFY